MEYEYADYHRTVIAFHGTTAEAADRLVAGESFRESDNEGNAPDVTEVLEVVDAIPDVRGTPGRPRRRPEELYGDRAYDSDPHREALRDRGIQPKLARRRTEHGSGLGKVRWVVERFLGWLQGFRKLRLRTDWALQTHDALLTLGCALICLRIVLNPDIT